MELAVAPSAPEWGGRWAMTTAGGLVGQAEPALAKSCVGRGTSGLGLRQVVLRLRDVN